MSELDRKRQEVVKHKEKKLLSMAAFLNRCGD